MMQSFFLDCSSVDATRFWQTLCPAPYDLVVRQRQTRTFMIQKIPALRKQAACGMMPTINFLCASHAYGADAVKVSRPVLLCSPALQVP